MIFKLLPLLWLIISCAQMKQVPTQKVEPAPIQYKVIDPISYKECMIQLRFFKQLEKLSSNHISIFHTIVETELCTSHLDETKKLLSGHSKNIGIIFPNSDKQKNLAILKGLKKSHSLSKVFVAEVRPTKNEINKALGNMIFKKKIGLLLTWGPEKMLGHIEKWQEGLKLPTIYINKKINKNPLAFKMYPNKANYAFEMITELRKRNIKRIAILTPFKYQNAQFIQDMKKVFQAAKIKVVFDVTYDSNNYDTMDFACREIFVIDRYKRQAEYNAIYREEKRKANAQGFGLNKNLVFLPAQVNFDAIFIPDNFKMVNHFAKLFQYYQAKDLTLFGTHEWRSEELVETNKSYLDGSFFVDFIDSPQKFNESRLSPTLDYKLMGYFSGLVAKHALKKAGESRESVTNALIKMKFSKDKAAFRRNEFNWPTYAFEIQENRLIPTN